MSPYVSEYSCRLLSPAKISKAGCRSMDRTHEGRPYRAIICQFYDTTKWLIQSLRYPTSKWTRSQALAHCQEYEGQFEDIKQPEQRKYSLEDIPGRLVKRRQIIKTEGGIFVKE